MVVRKKSSTAKAKVARRAVRREFKEGTLKNRSGEVIHDPNAALAIALKESGQPGAKFRRRTLDSIGGDTTKRKKAGPGRPPRIH
jgi:hypothetical protein